jgi:hypothetical protein
MFDLLILIAGAAVGFAGCRAESAWYSDWEFRVQLFAGFFLMLASWLILIFRARRPRPPFRSLARQPGVVACFAVVTLQLTIFITSLLQNHLFAGAEYRIEVGVAIWSLLAGFDPAFGAIVPICWALLLANRRWRPEPGWIDRSGRIVGWAWIAWMLVWPWFYAISRS